MSNGVTRMKVGAALSGVGLFTSWVIPFAGMPLTHAGASLIKHGYCTNAKLDPSKLKGVHTAAAGADLCATSVGLFPALISVGTLGITSPIFAAGAIAGIGLTGYGAGKVSMTHDSSKLKSQAYQHPVPVAVKPAKSSSPLTKLFSLFKSKPAKTAAPEPQYFYAPQAAKF